MAERAGVVRQRLLQPARDLVGIAREHLDDPGPVVEADERLGDDEAALRERRPVRGE